LQTPRWRKPDSNLRYEAEAEAGVRHRAIAAQIAVPGVVLLVDAALQHVAVQHLEPLLALAAVRNDLMLGYQLFVVDPHHDGQVGAIGRGRNENPFDAGLDVLCRLRSLGEFSGAFERHIDAVTAPGQLHRIGVPR